ncbi:MAG: LytTR family DNA-binding domain-containing protein [Clostridiales bacterium]|nr:LytTR family DNA-binding domain-containing protein [Lachnospiraceae bacterium]MCD7922285.1 LytTR family DNA-binding domain-containing protein [Clostridiales bacterium]
MQIAICDDDQLFIDHLTKYIKEFFKRSRLNCPDIRTFNSGEALLHDSSVKDIVFLDVEMPGVSGIFTGNELKKANRNVLIIIITAYSEYLDEAMRFQVFRYLSKPLEKQRLFLNLKDALRVYSTATFKVPVETKHNVYSLPASEIIYIEAVQKKVFVHTMKKDYESIQTLSKWMQILPSNSFFQPHRSFIVNFAHVSDFDHSLIHLCGDQFTAYLTRRKYTEFKSAYLFYLESMR